MTDFEKITLVQKQISDGDPSELIEKAIRNIGEKFAFEKNSLSSALFLRDNS